MKYTREERLEIGRRAYEGEFTYKQAAEHFGVNMDTVKDYVAAYRKEHNLPPRQPGKAPDVSLDTTLVPPKPETPAAPEVSPSEERSINESEDSLFKRCFEENIAYDKSIARSALIRALDQGSNAFDEYRQILSLDPDLSEKTFFAQLRRENFERLIAEQQQSAGLDEETTKNRLAVMEILSYDPFKDDTLEDRPQLYRDMASMLTESMRKDVAKAKAALAIVRGYNNLEKYQRRINELTQSGTIDDDTQKTIDQLIKVQKTLQDTVNATAEKNNFTVKGIGTSGRGMLSDVMNRIGDYGIDEGVVNFYDIATSRAIEEVASISFKAQLNQVNFSKTDYADIISQQSKMVKEAQARAREAVEALRVAKEKIKKQKLLDELAAEYRKKGIREAEIEAFIDREYKMYDMG